MSHTAERAEQDSVKWFPRITVAKYSPDQSEYAERKLRESLSRGRRLLVPRIHGDFLRELFDAPEDGFAYTEGNSLVAGGLYSICNYLLLGTAASGANGRALTNAQTGCGVGSGSTAFAVSQTALAGDGSSTTAWYQQMDATYPANAGTGTANGGQLNGQMTVASGNGNFNWQEWCWWTMSAYTAAGGTLASAAANTLMLNRWTGTSLGTKGAGATWVFSSTITFS